MKILLISYKVKLFNMLKKFSLLLKYFKLFNMLINFLMILWVTPLDFFKILDLCNHLIEGELDAAEKKTEEIDAAEKKTEEIDAARYRLWIIETFLVMALWASSCFFIWWLIGGPGPDVGSWSWPSWRAPGPGEVPVTDSTEVNFDESSTPDTFVSLLDEIFGEPTVFDEIPADTVISGEAPEVEVEVEFDDGFHEIPADTVILGEAPEVEYRHPNVEVPVREPVFIDGGGGIIVTELIDGVEINLVVEDVEGVPIVSEVATGSIQSIHW